MKPADAVMHDGSVSYPPDTDNLHHEVELVVAIGHGGANIEPANAWAHIFGYAVGIDLTRRDRQNESRAAQQPWDKGKGFDQSAPLGLITPSADLPHLTKGAVSLTVNGEIRQSGDLSDLIWPVPDILAILSRSWRLERGDLIFTGTPEGVGPLARGDEVVAHVDGLDDLRLKII
jgi:fumarylpyruvate hydrolase